MLSHVFILASLPFLFQIFVLRGDELLSLVINNPAGAREGAALAVSFLAVTGAAVTRRWHLIVPALAFIKYQVDGLYLIDFSRSSLVSADPALLAGKTVLITGGNSGVGLATAETVAALGAEVTIACRSKTRCIAAAASLTAKTGKKVNVGLLDLANRESIASFVAGYPVDHLDYLFNNGGFGFAPDGPVRYTSEGLELGLGSSE